MAKMLSRYSNANLERETRSVQSEMAAGINGFCLRAFCFGVAAGTEIVDVLPVRPLLTRFYQATTSTRTR